MVLEGALDSFFAVLHAVERRRLVAPDHGSVKVVQSIIRRKLAAFEDEALPQFVVLCFDDNGTFMAHQEFLEVVVGLGRPVEYGDQETKQCCKLHKFPPSFTRTMWITGTTISRT